VSISSDFGAFVTFGSLAAVPLVLHRFGTTRYGLGLLLLLGFWVEFGLRLLSPGSIRYPRLLSITLAVVGGFVLVVGISILGLERHRY